MSRLRPYALCLVLLGLGALSSCQGKQAPSIAAQGAAPEFRATTLDGKDFDLAELRGQVVLLNTWATWCKPCREELPELARLHRKLGDRGFTVIGVNVDVARLEKRVRRMATDFELPFPVVLDPKNTSVPKFEVVGYPTSFVIGRDGTIRWRRDGLIFENDEELAGVLESALAE